MVAVCAISLTAFVVIRFRRHVARQRIVQRQHGHRGAQHIHRRRLPGALQERGHLAPESAGCATSPAFSSSSSACFGSRPFHSRIDDFFKRRLLRERMNVESLIAQNSRIAVDKTNPRFRRNDSLETRTCNRHDSFLFFS